MIGQLLGNDVFKLCFSRKNLDHFSDMHDALLDSDKIC